jgi:hypothetical protein
MEVEVMHTVVGHVQEYFHPTWLGSTPLIISLHPSLLFRFLDLLPPLSPLLERIYL